jgi:hypothetical protein
MMSDLTKNYSGGTTTAMRGTTSGGSGGTEKRTQILPSVPVEDTGYMLPDYDLAGNIPDPTSYAGPGISSGGSLQHVFDAGRGILYYSDVIAFGQASSGLTSSKPFKKMGLNFFLKSALTCSNGAKMSVYFEGIPKGDAFGKKIKTVLANLGLPGLQGLAPGMLEDVQHAMDVRPILQSAFGNVYPECEQVTLPVGDNYGQTQDPETGDVWIKTPVEMKNGRAHQTRWVQKGVTGGGKPVYITKDQWDATPKTHNLDGTEKKIVQEEFENVGKASLLIAIVLLCGAVAVTYNRK